MLNVISNCQRDAEIFWSQSVDHRTLQGGSQPTEVRQDFVFENIGTRRRRAKLQTHSEYGTYYRKQCPSLLDLTVTRPDHRRTQDAELFTLDRDRDREHSLSQQPLRSLSNHVNPEIYKSTGYQGLFRIRDAMNLPSGEMLDRHKQAFEQRLQEAHQSREPLPGSDPQAPNAGPETLQRASHRKPNPPAMHQDSVRSQSNRRRISELFRQLGHTAHAHVAEVRHELESTSLTAEDKGHLLIEQILCMDGQVKSDKSFRELICEILGVKCQVSE